MIQKYIIANQFTKDKGGKIMVYYEADRKYNDDIDKAHLFDNMSEVNRVLLGEAAKGRRNLIIPVWIYV